MREAYTQIELEKSKNLQVLILINIFITDKLEFSGIEISSEGIPPVKN